MANRLCTCSDVPFYHDCECSNGTLGVEDIFEEVMLRAREAELFYCCMVQHAQCEVDKEMFRQFSLDQRRHYALLQQILRELTCRCYCIGEVCIEEPTGFCTGVKLAIYNEMQLSNDYENLAYYLTDMQQREILLSMIRDSRQHAERLAELYKFAQDCACRDVAGETDEECCCCMPCCCGCGCGCNGKGKKKGCGCCGCGFIPFCMPGCCGCCGNCSDVDDAEDEDDEDCITYCCMDDDTCPCSCGRKPDKQRSCKGNPARINKCKNHGVAGDTDDDCNCGCKKCNCSSVQGRCWGSR